MICGRPVTLGSSDVIPLPSAIEEKDVLFVDYDGTVLYSYTAEEFLAMDQFPQNPTHDGLIAQGWNWSFSGARSYVAECGKLMVGQVYTTSDGETKVYIHLIEGRTSPYLGLAIDGTVEVDWGDGSQKETMSGTALSGGGIADIISTQHEYVGIGDYVISIKSVSGQFAIRGTLGSGSTYYSHLLWKNNTSKSTENNCYRDAVQKVHIGDGCVIGQYGFFGMRGLAAVTIPNGITMQSQSMAFDACYSLKSIVIPENCVIPQYCFYGCYALSKAVLPENCTGIGENAFRDCRSIRRISLPANINSLSTYVFYCCLTLESVTIPSRMSVLGYGAFYCTSIREITLPTSMTDITNELFNFCADLTEITIPENVTSMTSMSFNNCTGLRRIIFKSTTPPTVSASGGWLKLPTDCELVVPAGCLSAYTSAANYPSSSVYTYVEES